MKKIICLLFALLMCCTVVFTLCACDNKEFVDYVEKTKLDTSTSRKRMVVTMRMHIDGDTTHFYADQANKSFFVEGVLKARYLGIDTPESTGEIEAWGKQASNFTKDKLEKAYSIMVESNTSKWDADSTGGRYLVWVWYQPEEGADYRLLNLELLQEGLAKIKEDDDSVYMSVNAKATDQARSNKLKLYGDELDPLYWYSGAQEMSIKQLSLNMADYDGQKVAFEATVVYRDKENNGLYVQSYDEEDQRYYGIYIFYGYNFTVGLSLVAVGNKVHFVGTVSEHNGSYQLSDIRYDPYATREEDKKVFVSLLDTNQPVEYVTITGNQFHSNVTVTVDTEGNTRSIPYYEAALNTAVTMESLTIKSVYQTVSEDGEKKGITLTCTTPDGKEISIRTDTLHEGDSQKNPVITEDYFTVGGKINVKGFITYFKWLENPGVYQIQVKRIADITIIDSAE